MTPQTDTKQQKVYPCDPEDDVSKCLENVDPNAWTSYSNFYTHTHLHICYFLKSQQWQELTDQEKDNISNIPQSKEGRFIFPKDIFIAMKKDLV